MILMVIIIIRLAFGIVIIVKYAFKVKEEKKN